MHVIHDFEVTEDAGATANGTPFSHVSASRDACATGNRGKGSDMNVVGDLHQVVDDDGIANHRVVYGPAVDRGMGANFDVIANHDATHLGNSDPARRIGRIAEAVATDHDPVLQAHPGAEDTVIAVPHEKWGQRPLAVVVPKRGDGLNKAELDAFLEQRFARWMLPDEYIFADEIPKTSTGKFSKKTVRERFGLPA